MKIQANICKGDSSFLGAQHLSFIVRNSFLLVDIVEDHHDLGHV